MHSTLIQTMQSLERGILDGCQSCAHRGRNHMDKPRLASVYLGRLV
jgi:hypothetical protein